MMLFQVLSCGLVAGHEATSTLSKARFCVVAFVSHRPDRWSPHRCLHHLLLEFHGCKRSEAGGQHQPFFSPVTMRPMKTTARQPSQTVLRSWERFQCQRRSRTPLGGSGRPPEDLVEGLNIAFTVK